MSKIIRIFLNFFSLKNINLVACILLLTFFDNFNFKALYLVKSCLFFYLLIFIWQNFFYEKVLFITQLSSHLMRKLLKKKLKCYLIDKISAIIRIMAILWVTHTYSEHIKKTNWEKTYTLLSFIFMCRTRTKESTSNLVHWHPIL